MEEIAIEVKNVFINYKNIKNFSIQRNLLKHDMEKAEIFEAIKGVSFHVQEGEILGIVGRNGSGKSTLLRAIAGVFCPNTGTIDLKGHSVSLLSLGVGFKDTLSGRDNIYLSGMLLGFTEQQIKDKEHQIIEFSELGEFIDKPVKNYSSGMYSKLAFAITSHLETDIMLVDEILSVGDEHFQKKSFARMEELIYDRNRTVVIVSHNLPALRRLCNRIIWLNDGIIEEIGAPDTVIDNYETYMC